MPCEDPPCCRLSTPGPGWASQTQPKSPERNNQRHAAKWPTDKFGQD